MAATGKIEHKKHKAAHTIDVEEKPEEETETGSSTEKDL